MPHVSTGPPPLSKYLRMHMYTFDSGGPVAWARCMWDMRTRMSGLERSSIRAPGAPAAPWLSKVLWCSTAVSRPPRRRAERPQRAGAFYSALGNVLYSDDVKEGVRMPTSYLEPNMEPTIQPQSQRLSGQGQPPGACCGGPNTAEGNHS